MALTADPVFIVPAYGWERAAWFAVHILASDAATSGLPLRWMAVDLNLPPEITDEELSELWDGFHRACEGIGVAVVTGHTARYDGCAWPMVGGAVCIASGPQDRFVTPTMARPGDRVVVTKGAAIEATALFAATFPDRLAESIGADVVERADALFERMTVVPEATVARTFGLRDEGVTSMHDATEGGVFGGITEVAAASEVGMRIELDAIPVREEVRAVCDHVGMDPYTSISEGTLIATVVADRAERSSARWRARDRRLDRGRGDGSIGRGRSRRRSDGAAARTPRTRPFSERLDDGRPRQPGCTNAG